METYKISFTVDVDNETLPTTTGVRSEGAYEALKKLEHHAEYLIDLDNWPCIKTVSDFKVVTEANKLENLVRIAKKLHADDNDTINLLKEEACCTYEEAVIALCVFKTTKKDGSIREMEIFNNPHFLQKSETWNSDHMVVNVISANTDIDGYSDSYAVDIITQSICG